MRRAWRRWLAAGLAVCISIYPAGTVSAAELSAERMRQEETLPQTEERAQKQVRHTEEAPQEAERSKEEQLTETERSKEELPQAEYPQTEEQPQAEYLTTEEVTQADSLLQSEAPSQEEAVQIGDDGFVIPPLNYIDIEDEVDSVTQDPDYIAPMYGVMDSKYDPLEAGMNLPAIRNQNPYGSCWAHSSVGLGEVAYYKQHPAERDMELSELHLAYFHYCGEVKDPLGGLEGDSNRALEKNFMERGGNLAYSSVILSSWIGAAEEEIAPYGTASAALENGLDASIAFTDFLHLQGVRKINIQKDADLVKEMIQQYGAVGISYYEDQSSHNHTYHSYYQDVQKGTNHAVMIVGWDDDFPKENFTKSPAQNGAWLIRNSWGGSSNAYSYRSYFWLSYEDTSISDTAYAFIYEDADNYDYNYQYDGSVQHSWISADAAANVFTAKASPSGKEVLRAVSFDTPSVNVSYTVEVYTDLTNAADPESGTLQSAATTSGVTTTAGYYTVPLNSEILLEAGTDFAVVVYLEKEAENPKISMEASLSGTWIESVAAAMEGQSFRKSGSWWMDVGKTYGRNVRIKAFTDAYSAENPVTAVTLSEKQKTLELGDTFTLTAVVKPVDTDSILTWKSSNSSVAVVDKNGIVTAVGVGSADITISADGVSASCTVTVKPKEIKAQSVQLDRTEVTIAEGESSQLTVSVLPSNTTDKTVWSSSDSRVVTVDSNGKITGKSVGTAVITAQAGSKSAKCSVTVKAKEIKAQSVQLNLTTVTVTEGEYYQLNATILPSNTTDKIVWSSSDERVVTTDNTGKITGKSAGTAVVTVSAGSKSDRCVVTVKAKEIKAEAISLDKTEVTLSIGESAALKAKVTPSNTTSVVSWNSSNPAVATVNAQGVVTAAGAGTAVITVSADGVGATCKVTVKKAETGGKFIDVSPNAYYAAPVDWAVQRGITSGTSATTFAPEKDCTRAQIVTFLWRAAGSPQPQSANNPFTDVKGNAYYYKAVLWAVEKGITSGTSATTFSPEATCTRGQSVTFLYRYAEQPSVGSSANPFADVKNGAYYYNPVLWAMKTGVTSGTSATTFAPDKNCTRGQIVTFLYRQAN